METKNITTSFAPAERSHLEILENDHKLFSQKNIFSTMLDSTSGYLIVLNKNRQVVYANKSALELLNQEGKNTYIGNRLGELLKCQHAFESEGGCGTTVFCRTCGSVRAMLSSLKGEEDVQECRIIQSDDYNALDFRVWAKPLEVDGHKYSIYTFVDISNEKRRVALERIFFHDVLNTAGGVKSYIDLLEEANPEEIVEFRTIAANLAENLIEEISAQRDLTLAENKELVLNKKVCDSNNIIRNVVSLYINHSVAKSKSIIITKDSCSMEFTSDPVLLLRVLGNMLRNALEAVPNNGVVTLGCKLLDNKLLFFVHNIGFIPVQVQNQIFNRSFSTKGENRGLGAYSMKLLTEYYLKGKIYFTSDTAEGTTFFVELPV